MTIQNQLNRIGRTRSSKGWIAGLARSAGSALLALALTIPAAAQVERSEAPLTVADWASEIWTNAQQGRSDSMQQAMELLRQIPEEHTHLGVRRMQESVAQWTGHEESAQLTRQESIDTALEEMSTALVESDYREALRAAIELQDLSLQPDTVTTMPTVRDLTERAAELAHEAEREGRTLEALDWFRRLDLLFETERHYYPDVLRVAQRVGLLAFYTPERLHELRNEFAVSQDEDPLPAYNDGGPGWQEDIQEISEGVLLNALDEARLGHIDGAGYRELALGGLAGIRTLLTTDDLSIAFAGLQNEADRLAMLRRVDTQVEALRHEEKLRRSELRRLIRNLVGNCRETVAIPDKVVYREFGNGAMSQLDIFSAIIWPDESQMFERTLTGEFIGVGIQIELDTSRQLRVVAPLDGTPAQRAGMKRGDLIRTIDGKSTVGISLNQAVDQITGEQGTQVALAVEREGEDGLVPFNLTRARIPLFTAKGWKRTGPGENDWDYFIDPVNRIGYLRLTSFSRDTESEFDRAISAMKEEGLRGLILDLRFNPGGLLSAATGISNRFVPNGTLVSTADKMRVVPTRALPFRATIKDLPTAVLINAGSASASEIVSGCLQDYERALIVGERSYGKGTVQQVMRLGSGGAYLKLTMQQYLLPSGRSIHRADGAATWGVEPDVQVKMTSDQLVDILELRYEADVTPVDTLDMNDPERPDPQRLLTQGLDPQLETALVLLQARLLADVAGQQTMLFDR